MARDALDEYLSEIAGAYTPCECGGARASGDFEGPGM
jgi:hypothetical protein